VRPVSALEQAGRKTGMELQQGCRSPLVPLELSFRSDLQAAKKAQKTSTQAAADP